MAIKVSHVFKIFNPNQQPVLHDVDFEIKDREFICITGRSGSGKTTLLYILSSLDEPTSGAVHIDGVNPFELSVKEVHNFRNLNIGFIFQFHYLLPELTAVENVLMPARKVGSERQLLDRAKTLLGEFGLGGKENRLPSQLSGGEQQRVSIARSLIMKPKYLFADEPTGNLDSANAKIVIDILKRTQAEFGTTVILVTHETDFAEIADRQIHLVDGRLQNNL